VTIRPGKNLLVACIVLAVASIGVCLATALLVPLVAALSAVAAASYFDYRAAVVAIHGITIRRDAPATVGRDCPLTVRYAISNANDLQLAGRLRDIRPQEAVPNYAWWPFEIAPRGRTVIETAFRVPVRCACPLGPLWVQVEGPWKLIEVQRPIESTATVRVLPETFASRDELIKEIGDDVRLLDVVKTSPHSGVGGAEIESLAPYQEGDDPRRIDWRATARAGMPIVRRYQVERRRDVMVVVDCGRMMAGDAGRGSKLDRAVDSALHLAGVALRGGDRCGLCVFDDRTRVYAPPRGGAGALRGLVNLLYDVRTEWREPDFTRMFAELQGRQQKRALVVVLSDLSDRETSAQLRTALANLAKRHLVLLAALRTPLLAQLVSAPVPTLDNGAQKAVAMRLTRERRQSLHELERSGVQVLDVEPQRLTMPLVNRFLSLRSGRLL
jgi:uncharacterized protein (DUF58 family)